MKSSRRPRGAGLRRTVGVSRGVMFYSKEAKKIKESSFFKSAQVDTMVQGNNN